LVKVGICLLHEWNKPPHYGVERGMLPLEFKLAYSVGDLFIRHLDELEEEAERKGGVL
jgi:hypothetical protein